MINENSILDISSNLKIFSILLLILLFTYLLISYFNYNIYYYYIDNFFSFYSSFNDISLIANMIFIHYPLILFLIGYLLLVLLLGILKFLII
jgi:hypothetical protein